MDTQAPSHQLDLPQWLAPEPLPYYHPSVVQAKQSLRENQRAIEHLTFESLFEDFLDLVRENGLGVNQLFDNDPRSPNLKRFTAWVMRDENRKARYYEAQEIGAEVLLNEIVAIADADDALEDVNRSTLRVNTRWKKLAVMSKKRFGDTKQIDQTVTINLGDAMREAQERLDRSRTVDVPVRRIG